MKYEIATPKNVNLIIKLLEQQGFEAFAVGGCVRDALMNREPQDWDITTSAAPDDIKSIFRRTIDTGLLHGTVTVMLDHTGYEVTTYRIDGSYSDGRHPDKVLFTNNLIEDLKRRDFTINAMAYNDKTGLVDEFDGIGDLERKIIKCVGNPVERFTEDALRMLRAVRFAAKLGFFVEEGTAKAIKDMASNIKKVSKERIHSELDKLITSDNPCMLKNIYTLGMDRYILEGSVLTEEDDDRISRRYDNIVTVMEKLQPEHYMRWTAFMLYEGAGSRKVLKGLKLDNKTITICEKVINNLGYFSEFQTKEEKKYLIKKLLVEIGQDVFENYYMPFMRAVVAAGIQDTLGISKLDDHVLDDIERLYSQICLGNDCISKNQMVLKGADLIELGVEPGKIMGEVIDRMFEAILKDPGMNDREKLIKMI